MRRSLRPPVWLRRPAGRAGATLASVATVAVVLAASVGIGYTVTQPALGDGSAFLSRGHTVVHVNGETGRSDAEAALQLATGSEEVQTVRLPDGRVAIVNKTTGTVTYLDASTLTPSGTPTAAPTSKGRIEPIPTGSEGYLVDTAAGTVSLIPAPGQPAAAPVQVPAGITAAVPTSAAAWILTAGGDVVEVRAGQAGRTIHIGETPAGITVADGHPVVVTTAGNALAVDGESPRGLGRLGVAGADLVTGSWRGAGRHVLVVDRRSGRLSTLDPRTGHVSTVELPVKAGAQLAAPVELGGWAYVPDYAGPGLWRINLGTGKADALEVAGQAGPFTLEVTGGRVWANNQYDRRALIVDGEGHERYVDKGAASDVGDSQGQAGGGSGGGTAPTGGPEPDPGDQPAPGGPNPAAERVTVPRFPAGTSYQDACAQLERVRLRCRSVAAGNASGRPGEVIGTDPVGGTQVAVGSRVVVRYVAPLKTPAVAGLARAEACRVITAARLTCDAQPDPGPAAAPELLDRVSTQDPVAGAPIGRGGRVRIGYANTIALPPLAGQTQGEACDRLTTYRMTCTAVKGDPAVGAGRTAGAVYAQNPAPATVVPIGTRVTVTFYAGDAPMGDYRGGDITAACAAVRAAGFTCNPVEGATAVGSGQAAGTVYGQDQTPGAVVAIGTAVALTYRSPNNDLPSYVGAAAGAACADIQARGFGCNAVADLHPSTNVVFAQDQGAGRYPIGSVVTIHYSPWGLVTYWIYQKNDADVWVLRPEGQIPAGYGRQAFRVGAAYAPGTAIPGASNIYGFFCTVGGGRCNGLDVNHFYSRATSYPDPLWQGPTNEAVFMSCTGAGTPIYRTWNAGSPRFYKITSNPGGAAGVELLGCVW